MALSASVLLAGCTHSEVPKIDEPIVEIGGRLPTRLPAAVKDQANNVISVLADWSVDRIATSSGVRIAPNWFLTAGHTFRNAETNSTLVRGINECGRIAVEVSTDKITYERNSPDYEKNSGRTGASIFVDRQVSSLGPTDGIVPDLAIAHASDDKHVLPPFSGLTFAYQEVKAGQPLFTINYQAPLHPAPDGINRLTPNEALLSNEDLKKGYNKPSEIGMIVIDEHKGKIVAVSGIKNYQPRPDQDPFIEEGASGGPVFTSKGRFVGIVVDKTPAFPASKVMELTKINLKGIPKSQPLNVVLIQQIGRSTLTRYENRLAAASDCTQQ